MKKEKKKKEKAPKLVVGKVVKEIKIDKSQHITELSFAVAVFAIILLGGLASFCFMFDVWFVWLISGILLIYFLTHSVLLVMKATTHAKYLLCENCLVVNSIWHYCVIELKDIKKIETKHTIFDGKKSEKRFSLVINYEEKGKKKATLHSILEDKKELLSIIDEQVKKCK